jgi:hypothetical protein
MHLNCYTIVLANCDVTADEIKEALKSSLRWGVNLSITEDSDSRLQLQTGSKDILDEADELLKQYLHIRSIGNSHQDFMTKYR